MSLIQFATAYKDFATEKRYVDNIFLLLFCAAY